MISAMSRNRVEIEKDKGVSHIPTKGPEATQASTPISARVRYAEVFIALKCGGHMGNGPELYRNAPTSEATTGYHRRTPSQADSFW